MIPHWGQSSNSVNWGISQAGQRKMATSTDFARSGIRSSISSCFMMPLSNNFLKRLWRPLADSLYFSIRAVSVIPARISIKTCLASTVILAIESPPIYL